jgi:hemolysin activation/secretion protein
MTMNVRLLLATAWLVAAGSLAPADGARAQTTAPSALPVTPPPTVPRPSDLAPRPDATVSDPTALPQPAPDRRAPREVGKPSDEIEIDVVRYAVADDAPAELRAALATITAPYVGKGRHYEDLTDAAADVGRFLQRELGYYLGYAYIPEQLPDAGVIRIAILEGRLDRIDLKWSDGLPVNRTVVENYLSRLQPGSVLRVSEVERVVFLINDLHGMNAQFEFKAGSQPGTSVLVVTPRAEQRLTARAEVDSNGSRYLGTYRLGGLVSYNSPFGRGDAVTVNALASSTGGLTFALASYTAPIGGSGLKFGVSVSGVAYQLDKVVFPQLLKGTAVSANAYLLYPWIRARNLNLFVLASAEQKTYSDKSVGSGTEDRKNVTGLTLGTTGDFRDSLLSGGVNTFELNASTGQLKYPLGQQAGSDVALTFSKVSFGFTRLQNLVSSRLLLYVAGRAQAAFANLDNTEQFRIGGPDGVRAFAPGEGTGDQGGLLTAELRLLPPEEWLGRFARETVFSAFYDIGRVMLRYDSSKLSRSVARGATFSGAGVGLTWVRQDKYSVRVSLAKPVSGIPKADPQPTDIRLYSQFSLLF